jgi:hypothetical protein
MRDEKITSFEHEMGEAKNLRILAVVLSALLSALTCAAW